MKLLNIVVMRDYLIGKYRPYGFLAIINQILRFHKNLEMGIGVHQHAVAFDYSRSVQAQSEQRRTVYEGRFLYGYYRGRQVD